MRIKVGVLISYDYQYALRCIHQVYAAADCITLALDKEYRTWNGGTFTVNESFFHALQEMDVAQKIEVYRDNFYVPGLSAMENETRERNLLAEKMGLKDGWHIQVDADEYFVDFGRFVEYLHAIEPVVKGHKVTIMADWITLFKKDERGYYVVISGEGNRVPIATNYPVYDNARVSHHPSMIHIECSHCVLHESWSRSDDEIRQKLSGWGHTTDFNTDDYMRFWQSITPFNAPYIKDFHPLPWQRNSWHALEFVAGGLDALIEEYQVHDYGANMHADIRKLKKSLSLCKLKVRQLRSFVHHVLKLWLKR